MACYNCHGTGTITVKEGLDVDINGYLREKSVDQPCPVCAELPLSERQIACFAQLPEKGWHWVQKNSGGPEYPIWIDKTACKHRNDHESRIMKDGGHVWTGSDSNIGVTERWLNEHTILGPVEPFKHPALPENFGMF